MARLKETLPCLVHTFALLLFCVGGESSVCHLGIPTLWTSLISIWDLWFELDLFFFTAQRHPSPLESIWLLSPVGPWTGSRRRLHDWSQQWSRSPSLEIEPVALFFFGSNLLRTPPEEGGDWEGNPLRPSGAGTELFLFFSFSLFFFVPGLPMLSAAGRLYRPRRRRIDRIYGAGRGWGGGAEFSIDSSAIDYESSQRGGPVSMKQQIHLRAPRTNRSRWCTHANRKPGRLPGFPPPSFTRFSWDYGLVDAVSLLKFCWVSRNWSGL